MRSSHAAPLPRAIPLRSALLALGVVGVVLALGYGLAGRPWLTAGLALGAGIFTVALFRPLAVVGAMLAVGPIDLSFLTGGFKGLLAGQGGIDMNGIRLIGIVAALAAVVVVDPAVLREAIGRYGRWYLLFLAYAAATLAYSPDVLDGMRLLLKLAYPFLLFVVVLGAARSEDDIERLVTWTLLGTAVIVLLLNPLYVIGGGYGYDVGGRLRIHGVGIHENPFSFYLLLMMLLCYARYTARGQLRYLLLALACGGWMVLTLTRITLLAAVAAFGGVAVYQALVQRNYRAFAVAALLTAAVAVPLFFIGVQRSLGYVPHAGELFALLTDPGRFWRSVNWQGRQRLWPVVLAAFLRRPVFGLGLGASTAVLSQNFPPEWGRVIHNEYLRLATETGVVGCVLFLLGIFAWWRGALRTGRSPVERAREMALPAAAGIIAWAVISATDNPFDYYAPFTQYIGFFCAAALVLARRREGASQSELAGG